MRKVLFIVVLTIALIALRQGLHRPDLPSFLHPQTVAESVGLALSALLLVLLLGCVFFAFFKGSGK